MSGRKSILLAALAAAPLAWAQLPPPALKDLPPSPPSPPASPAAAPAAPTAAPAATAEAQARPPLSDLLRTRIEQVKRGNRVSEVRVTGVDGEVRYTMDVQDARAPTPTRGTDSGLSTPNFLNIEF